MKMYLKANYILNFQNTIFQQEVKGYDSINNIYINLIYFSQSKVISKCQKVL